nr:immunoglobulin light chain junction region [Macaca mulatta]MOV72865.1 immunoglobulin light chain junction region [Macaca mulatta]MOV73771.1 immunoglobulin light chain junction region [Macaca mulatta]
DYYCQSHDTGLKTLF